MAYGLDIDNPYGEIPLDDPVNIDPLAEGLDPEAEAPYDPYAAMGYPEPRTYGQQVTNAIGDALIAFGATPPGRAGNKWGRASFLEEIGPRISGGGAAFGKSLDRAKAEEQANAQNLAKQLGLQQYRGATLAQKQAALKHTQAAEAWNQRLETSKYILDVKKAQQDAAQDLETLKIQYADLEIKGLNQGFDWAKSKEQLKNSRLAALMSDANTAGRYDVAIQRYNEYAKMIDAWEPGASGKSTAYDASADWAGRTISGPGGQMVWVPGQGWVKTGSITPGVGAGAR